MGQYLERALGRVKGLVMPDPESSELVTILEEAAPIDQAKVAAIGEVLRYMGAFNDIVRSEIDGAPSKSRHGDIAASFDSIREEAKTFIEQWEDDEISLGERTRNFLVRMVRGSIPDRFDDIKETYQDVARDTREQLDHEENILRAYENFRYALKGAEERAFELRSMQEARYGEAQDAAAQAASTLEAYVQNETIDDAQRSRLELARDEAASTLLQEQSVLHLVRDVATQLGTGYDVGETVMAKLGQTHAVKKAVHRRMVLFFDTNEHVLTSLSAAYVAQLGLHESTATGEAYVEGMNKALEDLATTGTEIDERAREFAYGATYKVESVRQLVDAIVDYQTTTQSEIARLTRESDEAAAEIRKIVDDGKEAVRQSIRDYAARQ